MKYLFWTLLYCIASMPLSAQTTFTKADTLRGTINPERSWWNVLHYAISVEPDIASKTIRGTNLIRFSVTAPGKLMQIDLQEPMAIESIYQDDLVLKHSRQGSVYYVEFPKSFAAGDTSEIRISFSGKPVEAHNPPWDGGWIWEKDALDRPWITVACQGLGASAWMPCKDHQSDEPDLGARLTILIGDSLQGVGNGKLMETRGLPNGKTAFTWEVVHPINSYNIIPYIGHYVNWKETYNGINDSLILDYWVIDENLEIAKEHFSEVPGMLDCFEDWFGPYPFYGDGYKLVESPHLGMEHQSAIAYGNKYRKGYLGRDLSSSGWGMRWDFIIIHESGHEWFGNSITSKDIADMWIHEGFTAYSETIYTQCQHGTAAGNEYVVGTRRNINNDKPIIGPYGVNREGSGDMYFKAANMIHTIRHVVDNDSLFKAMMRELNATFFHQTVTTVQVEGFINEFLGRDFSKVFDQYLRTTEIPELQFRDLEQGFEYRWAGAVPGFNMPVRLADGRWLEPISTWQTSTHPMDDADKWKVDKNFYVGVKLVK